MVIVLQCDGCQVRTEIRVVEGMEASSDPYNIVKHCPICGTTDCAELMMYSYDETIQPEYRLIKSHRSTTDFTSR